MREQKFRARAKNGNWWYGSSLAYQTIPATNTITLKMFWEWVEEGVLDPETVGQYTSKKDGNGKEIYEGDRVEGTHYEEQGSKPVIWWQTGWYTGYDDGQCRNVTSLSAVINPIIIGNIYEGLYSGEHSHLLEEN